MERLDPEQEADRLKQDNLREFSRKNWEIFQIDELLPACSGQAL